MNLINPFRASSKKNTIYNFYRGRYKAKEFRLTTDPNILKKIYNKIEEYLIFNNIENKKKHL